jgi:hypothetical protein
VIFAPPFDAKGEWHEINSGMQRERSHTFDEITAALGGKAKLVMTP